MVDTDGLEFYLVGGFVRDEQLDREPNDKDFVVVGATPEEMLDRGFGEPVGEAFAVFIHPETGDEWALARTEESTGDSYKEFDVRADENVSLEDDLRRRDLRINAIAKNPQTDEITDPHGGLEDIEAEILHHVSPAFAEDPLRVIRVATFTARFPEFDVHPDTADLCKELIPKLATLSTQRIRDELIKMFQKAENPRRFFDTLREFGALEILFPHVADLTGVPAGPDKYHKEDSLEHTLRVVEEIASIRPKDVRAGLIALYHDVGKTLTDSDEFPHHFNHTGDKAVELVDEISQSLQLSNEHQGLIKSAVRFHMHAHNLSELTNGTLIELSEHLHVENTGELDSVPHMTRSEFIALGRSDQRGRISNEISTISKTDVNRLIQAEQVINDIGGEEVLNRFEPNNGEHIGELIHQERVRELRNRT